MASLKNYNVFQSDGIRSELADLQSNRARCCKGRCYRRVNTQGRVLEVLHVLQVLQVLQVLRVIHLFWTPLKWQVMCIHGIRGIMGITGITGIFTDILHLTDITVFYRYYGCYRYYRYYRYYRHYGYYRLYGYYLNTGQEMVFITFHGYYRYYGYCVDSENKNPALYQASYGKYADEYEIFWSICLCA